VVLAPIYKTGPARVLLVEDEVLIRVHVADELRDAGFVVIEVGSADEAWSFLASGGAVDIVLSDIMMPGSMNGRELARRVRATYPVLPIILTSANPWAGGGGEFAPIIGKPYDIEDTISLVTTKLRQSWADDER
jgi:DNA-binding NtrC family response regulator